MLVLSRQRDETIMIGDEIEITVVDIRGDKVRLGITAPSKIAVHRKEVYDAIKAENQRASQFNKNDLPSLRPPNPPTTGPSISAGPLRDRINRTTTPLNNPPLGLTGTTDSRPSIRPTDLPR